MRKIVSVLVLALCCVVHLWAQEEYDAHLVGHVLDERTGEHLPFVNVQVKGTNIGTVTDESGHFFMKNLPLGKQVIVFSYVGYETVELPVRIEQNKTVELKAAIHELTQFLNSVVVTANRYETKRQEASTIVNVLSPKLFETTAVACVADVLNFQPGLRVENTCSNCGKTELRINGLQGQYTQILMDSRPVFSSMASVYGLEQVPAAMIDRIEVIRGGGSAMYGANAIGGVVNIITKEPVRNFLNISNTSMVNEHAGYDIHTDLNASVLSENRKMGAYVFASHRTRSAYDRDDDGFSEIPKMRSTTAGARAFFKTSAYSKITAEYHHTTDFRRGGNRFEFEPHQADIAEQLRHNIDGGQLSFDWFSSDNKHFVSAYSALQHISRESYFGAGRDTSAYGRSTDLTSITGMQYRFSYPCGRVKGDLTVGAEYTFNGLHDRMVGYNRDISQNVHVVGAYAQNEWKQENWSVLVGARMEKHNLLKTVVCNPRATFRYTPLDGLVLRTGYSSGYRAPQTYDEDLHVAAVGGNVSFIRLLRRVFSLICKMYSSCERMEMMKLEISSSPARMPRLRGWEDLTLRVNSPFYSPVSIFNSLRAIRISKAAIRRHRNGVLLCRLMHACSILPIIMAISCWIFSRLRTSQSQLTERRTARCSYLTCRDLFPRTEWSRPLFSGI